MSTTYTELRVTTPAGEWKVGPACEFYSVVITYPTSAADYFTAVFERRDTSTFTVESNAMTIVRV